MSNFAHSLAPASMNLINRRTFLAGTMAAAASSISSSALTQETKSVRVGLLGASHSHALEKTKLLQASRHFEFIGISEKDTEVRERFKSLSVPWISDDQLMANADLVLVESAVRDHARHTIAALNAGKHVHVEKPPASTSAEFKQIVSLAREKKRLLQVGYMWRYHPGFIKIFELVQNGTLGEVYLIRSNIMTLGSPALRKEWNEFNGGSFFELACHVLDPIVRLQGKPERVSSFLRQLGTEDVPLNDNNLVVLQFPKATTVITNSALQPNAHAHRSFEVFGTKGTIILRPIEPPTLELDLADAVGNGKKGPQLISLPPFRRYEAELDDLRLAIQTSRPLRITLETEKIVQDTLLAACGMA